jgi:hypothetical protein
VGDRLLVVLGTGEQGGQQLRARQDAGGGEPALCVDVRAGRGSRPDRVERGHRTTVTPSGNRRTRIILTM